MSGSVPLRAKTLADFELMYEKLYRDTAQPILGLGGSRLSPREGVIALRLWPSGQTHPDSGWWLIIRTARSVHIDDPACVDIYELDSIRFDDKRSSWRLAGTPMLEGEVEVALIDVTLRCASSDEEW
jgi:hypothetical protein